MSLKGVTGAGNIDTDEVARQVPKIQQATGLPVGVGFGIKDGATAARVAAFADAVVIGSRLIEVLEQGPPEAAPARAGELLRSLRQAMDAQTRTAAARRAALRATTRSKTNRSMTWLDKILPPGLKRSEGTAKAQVGAGGAVDQVPVLRFGAVLHGPREQPQRLSQVRATTCASPRVPGSIAAGCGRPRGIGQEVRPLDPLKFKDSRKYSERLTQAATRVVARPRRWW